MCISCNACDQLRRTSWRPTTWRLGVSKLLKINRAIPIHIDAAEKSLRRQLRRSKRCKHQTFCCLYYVTLCLLTGLCTYFHTDISIYSYLGCTFHTKQLTSSPRSHLEEPELEHTAQKHPTTPVAWCCQGWGNTAANVQHCKCPEQTL